YAYLKDVFRHLRGAERGNRSRPDEAALMAALAASESLSFWVSSLTTTAQSDDGDERRSRGARAAAGRARTFRCAAPGAIGGVFRAAGMRDVAETDVHDFLEPFSSFHLSWA